MFFYKRLTTTKLNKIFLCFSEDLTATVTARIAGVNRNTVNRYFTIIREKIAKLSIAEYNQAMSGEAPPHFEARSVLGKKLKRVLEKRPVLGLLKRGKKVFITVIQDHSLESFFSGLRENLCEHRPAHWAVPEVYMGLQLSEYDQYRVCFGGYENGLDVKGIDNFLAFTKKRLSKFNGCSSGSLLLHLKECEFRYNHRGEDLFKLVKKVFQKY